MTQDGRNAQQSAGETVREAVTVAQVADVPVMDRPDQEIGSVRIQATILALIEAYTGGNGDTSMPWAALLAAASAVPSDNELLTVPTGPGRRLPITVSDALGDLLGLGLVEARPRGLRVTDEGCETVRNWNGEYTRRLEAAGALLIETGLAPS
jgi:hypothetical protein